MSPMTSFGPVVVTGTSLCLKSVSTATYPNSCMYFRLLMTERGRLGSSFLVCMYSLSQLMVFRPEDFSLLLEVAFIASYWVLLMRRSAITFPHPLQTKKRLLQTPPCFMKRLPNCISRGFKFSINRFWIAGVKCRRRGD